jgi:hypothetical protein
VYNNLVQERDNILNLITNFQNLLGINNLNDLPELPEGETLNSLLVRPTPADLQAERNRVNDLEREKKELTQKDDELKK